MISSKAIEVLTPLFNIVTNAKGKTIRQIKEALLIGDKCPVSYTHLTLPTTPYV